jgi:stage II sporulation protein D (peptidoglycan lytic transglycosylase)
MTTRLYRGFTAIVMILSLTFLLSGCGSRFAGQDILRVAVVTGSGHFNLGATDKIVVRENKRNRKIYSGNPAEQIKVTSHKRGIKFGNKLYGINSFTIVPRTDGSVSIDGAYFRGNFKVIKKDGGLWVVNYVNIDDYLKTVVPSEVSPLSDIDSLKAQAIVSRSYAIFTAIRNPEADYYMTGKSQAYYRGIEAEDKRSTKAVESTKGKVIYFKKKLLQAFCHASCGGYTENPNNVWPSKYEFPAPVRCKYCKDSKYGSWINKVSFSDIQKRLGPLGIKTLYAIKPYRMSRYGGRVTEMKINHPGGSKTVRFNKFRQLIGYEVIRSGFFKMEKSNGGIIFSGKGWGHGAGLCQEGARKLAEKGKSYKSIIKFYFPKTRIGRYKY